MASLQNTILIKFPKWLGTFNAGGRDSSSRAPKIVEGQINQAIELNGTSDHIALEDPKGLPVGDDTYAFEVWFFATEVGGAKGLL
ncbi:TPA: hypothetical protein EYN98_33320, partial [Candidatus Poribacteria bacterium]|nr:hypothetical protein [Candidatus Poribacteria bacterium]